jgi:uncharacterized protein (DUF305 family)
LLISQAVCPLSTVAASLSPLQLIQSGSDRGIHIIKSSLFEGGPSLQQRSYDKLSGMTGTDFDKEFVNHMIQDHQKDIADFTKEADAKDGKVSDLAAKQLPTLKKHLAMAQALQNGKQSSMQTDHRMP